jgi:heme transport system permease protein
MRDGPEGGSVLGADGDQGSSRSFIQNWFLAILAFSLAVVATLSLAIGATGVSLDMVPSALYGALYGTDDAAVQRAQLVIFDLRLPRTLIGMFVGAALAVSGAMMQGMFRNPLADPGLIGVSAGAALAAVATIALSSGLPKPVIDALGIFALPIAAFLGGIATTSLLLLVAGRGGQVMIATLLLTGIAFAALATAMMGLIAYYSDDRELRDLTLWQMGSLTGASWEKVLGIIPFAVLLAAALPMTIRSLNGLLLGEAEAFYLGINVERSKLALVTLTAAAVGAAVAMAGMIGFVGLITPHFVRLIAGPDHRIVIPASALLGAIIVLVADVIARVIVRPSELPIGIVMAIIGAPFFLHLVLKRSSLTQG